VTSISLQHSFSPATINYFSFSIGKNSIHGTPDDSVILRPALGLTFSFTWLDDFSGVLGSHMLKGAVSAAAGFSPWG
jgi:hypothetical protein